MASAKYQPLTATLRDVAERPRLSKGSIVRDRDVRQALHRKVLKEHHRDANTLVLNELGLRHGACRVDIAVVNGSLHGYEIKSDSDTLARLASQVSIYSLVLDYATLVVGEAHAQSAKPMVPDWWGVTVVTAGPRGGITFCTEQTNTLNPDIDKLALAELLWRPEAVEILQGRGADPKLLKKPRGVLYKHLAETVELQELRDLIRQRLKERQRWRGHRPPLSGDDSSIPIPT